MTHIYIEQNTGLTEEVSSSIISKLYELAISGDLDETSDLKGRLHSVGGYDVQVAYLNEHFDDLYITVDKTYISFEDPVVQRLMATRWGDGTGVTNTDMLAVTTLVPQDGFQNNTHIHTFNELGRFTTITTLNGAVFFRCTGLTSIDISNIQHIGMQALYECSNVQFGDLQLPNVVDIGQEAFRNDFGITSIFLADGCLLDGHSIFYGCSNMTQANLGNNPTFSSKAHSVFGECSSLQSVTGLSNLTQIPHDTFKNCTALTTLDFDYSKITNIGENSFSGCTSLSGSYTFPMLENIGARAFQQTAIQSVSFGRSLNLSDYCFRECTSLTSVQFPTGCKFQEGVFSSCTNLQTVSNLDNIQLLGVANMLFQNCSNLIFPSTITISSETNKSSSYGYWLDHAFRNCQLAGKNVILDNSIKGIGQDAFANTHLQSITANGVEAISGYAFSGVDAEEIILPNVSSYLSGGNGNNQYQIFGSNQFLKKVVLGHIKEIRDVNSFAVERAWFYGTPLLETLDIGDSIENIRVNDRGSIFQQNTVYNNFKYYIIRNTTVPTMTLTNGNASSNIIKSFGGYNNPNAMIYVPDSALNAYKTAENWSLIADRIHPLSEIEPNE